MGLGTFGDFVATDARLTILKALAAAPGHALNDTIIHAELDRLGHRRTREWTRQQIRHLADLSAVAVAEEGTVWVVSIRQAGLDHLDRRMVLEGVLAPSPGR
jgi:hypothetical protein